MSKKLIEKKMEIEEMNPVFKTKESDWMNLFELKPNLESELNEIFLFHGTREKYVGLIKETGLEERLGNLDGFFGSGIYFAEDPMLSHQFSIDRRNRTGIYHVFICRVLIGKWKFVTPQQLKDLTKQDKPRIAPLIENSNERYDSIVGQVNTRPREFVIYNRYQVYPEYLITYKIEL